MRRELPVKRVPLSTEVTYMNPWHATVAFLFDPKIQKYQNNPSNGFKAFGLQDQVNDEMFPSKINPLRTYAYGSMLKRNMDSQENKKGFYQTYGNCDKRFLDDGVTKIFLHTDSPQKKHMEIMRFGKREYWPVN